MVNMLATVGPDATTDGLWALGIVLVVAFAVLAGYDGVNLHLTRYRLWARAASRHEHLVHTTRAIAFPIALALVFTGFGGPVLWVGIAVLVVDTGLEIYDVAIEPASRADLGGLPPIEGVLHAILGTLRTAAIAVILIARPASAYRWTDATHLAVPVWTTLAVGVLIVSGAVTAVVHVVLATRPPDPPATTSPDPSDRYLLENR